MALGPPYRENGQTKGFMSSDESAASEGPGYDGGAVLVGSGTLHGHPLARRVHYDATAQS